MRRWKINCLSTAAKTRHFFTMFNMENRFVTFLKTNVVKKKSWRNFWVRIAVDDDDDDEDVHVCMEACFSDRNEWNLHINGFGLIKFWALYLLIDLKSSSLFFVVDFNHVLITRITQIEYWWVAQSINTTDRKLRKSWTFIQLFPTLLFNCAVLNTSTMNKF